MAKKAPVKTFNIDKYLQNSTGTEERDRVSKQISSNISGMTSSYMPRINTPIIEDTPTKPSYLSQV